MAGRIKSEDVTLVKERASIEDVVREHVTLRSAGVGSLKGLCPFHDEKSPSFTIRPALGSWHCFGCDEGGDVLSFIQKVEHLTFVESVERLAGKLGIELHYEEGGARSSEDGTGRRTRLIEAHRVAEEFYHSGLLALPEARTARDFLRARGFDSAAATRFGVGYAPRGGEELTTHLLGKGFTRQEVVAAGLSGEGRRGLYDRFRGRLVWPIRDITGDPVGFGARRIFDDDRIEAKYLNTAETTIYRKTSVLYGLDLAKKSIARERQVVIVEGYTDVMACHLAGADTAVATCGTSFGVEHIKTLRRILRDESGGAPARVVFTFDGDAAGQKAAMRAFSEDQRWASQSFVAVASGGQDPCELRLSGGDIAVRALIDDAVPMFEFAVRTTLARFDLRTAEGRVQGMRAIAPIVAGIRDRALRPEYTRTVAGWIGVEVEQVAAEVSRAARKAADGRGEGAAEGASEAADRRATGSQDERASDASVDESSVAQFGFPVPDRRDPVIELEHQVLQVMIQHPEAFAAETVDAIPPASLTAPVHRAVFDALRTAGPPHPGESAAAWLGRVNEAAPLGARSLLIALSVEPIKARPDPVTGGPDERYVVSLVGRLQEVGLTRRIADATSTLRRMESQDAAAARELSIELTRLQIELNQVRQEMS